MACTAATAHLRRVVAANAERSDQHTTHHDADRTLQEFRAAAKADLSYAHITACVTSGFPSNRIVVPVAVGRRTLACLHDRHRGVEATRRRARQTVFWPGIDSDIVNAVRACEPCQVLQLSQQQDPLMYDDNPSRPFESVKADFFTVGGKFFLVIADRLSGWPVVVPCGAHTTATRTIQMFCLYFREVGVPIRLCTDGEPQFANADFQNFMERWDAHHIVTSPHYPQSNGHAEAAVKSMKHLIMKTTPSGNIDAKEFARGLLELCNTPNHTGRSPSQHLYGHPLRPCVSAHPESSADWQAKMEDCDRRAAAQAEQVQAHYDQHARPLPKLCIGATVRIQDPVSLRWDKVDVVMGRSREYDVRLPSGRVWRRNCRHLHPVPPHDDDPLYHIPVVLWSDEKSPSAFLAPPVAPRRSQWLMKKSSARDSATSVSGEGGVDM
ncbi:uncharacterized protein K02A2.6-like [Portunus trituberculatus]|uniref:uncharacterized protein K02A2.6-like n=1 Tax=Portunus trituberculatus TaxID=210409 RepID=UPI001E1CE9F3|nr:uncharacterized protein K02A2.6-like [Portunus trituberculatus]